MASTPATDPATTKRRLALAITDFLSTSLTDGTLTSEDRESIEVATSCISDAFKIDPTDKAAVSEALGSNQNLLSIYSVYEKLRGKSTPSTEGSSSAEEGRPSTPATASSGGAAAPGAKNADAEKLKGEGNVALSKKDYKTAIDLYSKAVALSPTNPIYLSNRAAAYSATQQHELAKQDAEMATAADPKYTKAWSRLGLARFALGDAKGSMEAYKNGIDAEGSGGSEAMRKGYETAKRKVEQEGGDEDDVASPRSRSPPGGGAGGMPDLGSLASMLGGGGGGGGGMPDMSALMQNPMMRQMAQNLMSNPDMMNNLMNNPRLREMANQFGGGGGGGAGGNGGGGGGGGMPDMSSLINDPSIAEMARNFMGGAGGGAGGAGGGAGRGGG